MITTQVCVISSGRAANVPRVEQQFPGCCWYVPSPQVSDYRAAGASSVRGVDGTLPMKSIQLNQALGDWLCGGLGVDVVATVDDDIVRCLEAQTKKEVNLQQLVEELAGMLHRSSFYLAGPYGGTNTSWAPGSVKYYGRLPGAMLLHRASDKVAFDEDLTESEDLDFLIQHHVFHGGVLLHGGYCLENQWSDNEGGYQDCRSEANSRRAVKHLQVKWDHLGCSFKIDATKKNGISMRVPWKKIVDSSEAT